MKERPHSRKIEGKIRTQHAPFLPSRAAGGPKPAARCLISPCTGVKLASVQRGRRKFTSVSWATPRVDGGRRCKGGGGETDGGGRREAGCSSISRRRRLLGGGAKFHLLFSPLPSLLSGLERGEFHPISRARQFGFFLFAAEAAVDRGRRSVRKKVVAVKEGKGERWVHFSSSPSQKHSSL